MAEPGFDHGGIIKVGSRNAFGMVLYRMIHRKRNNPFDYRPMGSRRGDVVSSGVDEGEAGYKQQKNKNNHLFQNTSGSNKTSATAI